MSKISMAVASWSSLVLIRGLYTELYPLQLPNNKRCSYLPKVWAYDVGAPGFVAQRSQLDCECLLSDYLHEFPRHS